MREEEIKENGRGTDERKENEREREYQGETLPPRDCLSTHFLKEDV
jgi:hypothetical protein